MNDITYAVSVDVNNPTIPYNVYVASVLDSNVRCLEITLYQNGNVIALSNTATATASLVTDNVLVDDSINCTISDNIITVPLEDLQRHGNLDVQVTVTEDTKVLAIPFPIQVRVTPNIAENAQIDENSLGSYAEVVHEISEARGSYDKLKDRLDHTGAPTDEQVAEAVSDYLDEHSSVESTTHKKSVINDRSQTGDDDTNYPTVGAVRDFVNTKNTELGDYIDNELDDMDSAKADKSTTLAGYGITNAYTKTEIDNKGYLTAHQDISGKENSANKVTSVSDQSTDEQYPSAKAVYDAVSVKVNAADVNASLEAKADKVPGKGLSTNDYTTAEKNKLAGIEAGANKTVVDSALSASSTNPVQNKIVKAALDSLDPLPSGGAVGQVLTKTSNGSTWQNIQHQDISGKESTSNKKAEIQNQSQTGDSDTNYPTVGAVRDFVNTKNTELGDYIDDELSAKVDKVSGKGLSTNDYTTAEKNKLAEIEAGANKLPSGGSAGQFLMKTASAPEWKDIPKEYEFVNEIPQNADHSQKYVLPDGYIYEWQQGSPSVPYNANTRLINQSPKLNTDKDTLESRSGVLVSDLIPYGRDWKYSEDGRVYLSGISQIVPVYYSSLIVYYYRRDTGAYIGTLQSAQLSSMNHPANNAPISLPVSLKVSDPAIAFSGVDVSDPGKDIGYVRILLGISTQGNITENDVKDLVINVPFYDTPSTPDGWANTGVKHPYYLKDSIFDVSTNQVLYAVGDSITYGYGVGGNNYSWVKHVIDHNGYAAYGGDGSKNLGENNLGFCTNSTSSFGNHSIQDVVDGTSFAGADIVTVALGINDWKNANATLANFWSGMQYCFNKIRSDNPYCKIYYILPFNVSFAGSYSTFYGLGFKGDSDTTKCYAYKLQEFINLIKEKFEEASFKAYRVELIDMTECAAINRHNITTALIDDRSSGGSDYGLHPTAATHAVLGKEIARIIAESHIVNAEPIKVSQLTNDSGFLTLATLPIYNGGVQ